MTIRWADRVLDTASAPGTGNITVSGSPPTGFITFSAIPSITTSDTFYYVIADQSGANWEIGLGTWSGSNTFARTTVLASSNFGSLTNFSSGTQNVWLDLPASIAANIITSYASANLTAGFTATADAIGSVSSGTKTPVVANGDYHTITNNGAFTLGVPSTGSGNCASGVIEITNGSTPGAVTLTAWSKVVGSLDTTIGHVFQCNYQITPGGSLLIITEIV